MQKCESGGCIEVSLYETAIRLYSSQTGTTMQASPEEWSQFVDEIKAGKWDFVIKFEVAE